MKTLIVLLMIVRLTGNVSIDGVKATLETPVTLDSYIETGINSKMVLDNGIIVGSLKKGKVKDFRKNVTPVGAVAGTVVADVNKSKTTSTSSSRASEAKEDLDWEE